MAFKFTGIQQLMNELERIGDKAEKVKNEALEKGADVLKEEVVKNAPKQTGHLKKNITVTPGEDGKVIVHTGDAFYSQFLEFGTSKMKARPFFEKSFINKKDEIEEVMAEVIKKELNL